MGDFGRLLLTALLVFVNAPTTSGARSLIEDQRENAQSLATPAQVSIAEGLNAFRSNPAGLSRSAEQRAFFVSQRFVDSYKNWGIQAALIDGRTEDPIHWGFSFNHGNTKNLARFQDYSLGLSYNYDHLVLVGFGHRLTNFEHQTQTPERLVYGLNAGVLVFVFDWLSLGLSGENLYRTHKDAELTPFVVRVGASINRMDWRFAVDMERNHSDSKTSLQLSGEYQLTSLLITRAGYFVDTDNRDTAYSLGLGLEPSPHFHVNAAFRDQLKSSKTIFSSSMNIVF